MPSQTKASEPQTTAQQLAAIIKTARKIKRKHKGLNGDLDRLPMLTWVMFLMQNRMVDGYLLHDVINLIDGIHFDSSEEMHTLSRLYESLPKEMRDTACARRCATSPTASASTAS